MQPITATFNNKCKFLTILLQQNLALIIILNYHLVCMVPISDVFSHVNIHIISGVIIATFWHCVSRWSLPLISFPWCLLHGNHTALVMMTALPW